LALHRFLEFLSSRLALFFCVTAWRKMDSLAAFLLTHGLGGSLKIIEGLGFDRGNVRDHGLGLRINFQHRAATGAADFKGLRRRLCHREIVSPQAPWNQ
jgi:hypothetical protein